MPAPVALTLNLAVAPVDEEEALTGSGEGGIEPVDIIGSKHVVGHISLVDVDMSPLSALGLVAGHGVGKLDLQSGEVRVLAHGSHAVGLRARARLLPICGPSP